MVMWSLAGCASYYSAVRRYVVAECMRYSDPGGSDLGWRAGALDSGRERLESLAEGTRPYVPQECRQYLGTVLHSAPLCDIHRED